MKLFKFHLGREVPFYTLLGHSRCQSDFDELVSMASRPVDCGFCRMESILASFRPGKSGFGRMAEPSRSFRPGKSGFGRMGKPLEVVARSKRHPSDGPSHF